MAEKIEFKCLIKKTDGEDYSIAVLPDEISKLGATFQETHPYSNEIFDITIEPAQPDGEKGKR